MCMEEYKNMFNVLIHPTAELKKLKKTNLVEGIKYTTLGTLIPGILALLFLTFGMGTIAALFKAGGVGTAVGFVNGLIALITLVITNIIALLIGGAILWVIAKIFGLKKDIQNFIGVYGIILGISVALTWIPVVGWLIGIYSLYLLYVMLKEAMGMESNKAILTIIVPIILVAIIIAIVIATLGTAAFTTAAAYMTTMPSM